MGVEQEKTWASLEEVRQHYQQVFGVIRQEVDLPDEEANLLFETPFSLVEVEPSLTRLREVSAQFFSEFADPKQVYSCQIILSMLYDLSLDLERSPVRDGARRARKSLFSIGKHLREQAMSDFETGVRSLEVINTPLVHPDRKVQSIFGSIYSVLEPFANTEEKKFWLAANGHRATLGEVPDRADLSYREELVQRTGDDIILLGRKIFLFNPDRDELGPETLNLIVGALEYGRRIGYSPDAPVKGVIDLGEAISVADLNELLDKKKVYAIDDLARKKLRGIIDKVKRGGDKAVLDLVEVMLKSIPQATNFTMSTLSILLTEEDPYTPPDQEAEMLPPIDTILKLAADREHLLNTRARHLLSEAYAFYLERLSSSDQGEVTFGSYLFETLMPRNYPRAQKEVLLEIAFEQFGTPKPLNWIDLVDACIRLQGRFILSAWEGRSVLFPRDERPTLVQVKEIEASFRAGEIHPTVIWKGEYPKEEEVLVKEPVKEEVIYEALPSEGEMVEVTTAVDEEKVVEPALPPIELKDSKELPVAERLRRFLLRLERRGVIRDLSDEEAEVVMEEAYRKWWEISPWGEARRTNVFAAIGSRYLLKRESRQARGSVVPRLILTHGRFPFQTEKGEELSDVRVDIVIAEGEASLVLRLALNKNGALVSADSCDEVTQLFLTEVLEQRAVSSFTSLQLEHIAVNAANAALRLPQAELGTRATKLLFLALEESLELDKKGEEIVAAAKTERAQRQGRKGEKKERRARGELGVILEKRDDDVGVILYDSEQVSPYQTEKEFEAALQRGEVIIQRSPLSDTEIIAMRRHYERGGYSITEPVEEDEGQPDGTAVGRRGHLRWLRFVYEIERDVNGELVLDEDGNPVVIKKARVPTLEASARARNLPVPVQLLKADVWYVDPKTGQMVCQTLYTTYVRPSTIEPTVEVQGEE